VLPVEPEKVPGGHGVGAEEPLPHHEPAGHAAPVTPSLGVAVAAPRTQVQPAAQKPVGAERPVPAQKRPGVHATQAASDDARPLPRYVPLGHGKARYEAVAAGHA